MGRSKGSQSTGDFNEAERLAMAFRPAQFAPSLNRSREIFRVQPVVSHRGPLQRHSMSAASQRRAAASGLRYRSADCWRRPAALSTQAPSPPSRERRPAALSGAFAALSIDAVQLRGADPPHWVTRLPASAAVATSREDRRSPRSGSGRADSPKSVMAWVLSMAVSVPPDWVALVHRAWLAVNIPRQSRGL